MPRGAQGGFLLAAALALLLAGDLLATAAGRRGGDGSGRGPMTGWWGHRMMLWFAKTESCFKKCRASAPCDRFPYMTSIRDAAGVHRCGGVLVRAPAATKKDPPFVLTSAKCIDDLGHSPIVVIGACDRERTKILLPARTFVHEGWTGNASEGNDIALLWMSKRVKRKSIALSVRFEAPKLGEAFATLEWGTGEGAKPSDVLLISSDLRFVSSEDCSSQDSWGDTITESMACFFGGTFGQDTCPGRTGGPLLRAFAPGGDIDDGQPQGDTLLGLASFGDESGSCGEEKLPVVYTTVASHIEWIREKMAEATGQKLEQPSTSAGAPSPMTSPAEAPLAEAPAEPQDSNSETPSGCQEGDAFRGGGISGSYRVEGNSSTGSLYDGIVTIGVISEGQYRHSWYLGTSNFRGIATLEGDVATVDWGSTYPVVYHVQCNGSMLGTWDNGGATENLFPVDCPEEDPGIGGAYVLEGKDANGNSYDGVTTVMEEAPGEYRMNWKMVSWDEETGRTGVATMKGNALRVDWGKEDGASAVYDRHCEKGVFLGRWAGGNGSESLAPSKCPDDVGKDLSGKYDVTVVNVKGKVRKGNVKMELGGGGEYALVRSMKGAKAEGIGKRVEDRMAVEWSEGPAGTYAVDWCQGHLLGVWGDGTGFNVTLEHLSPAV
ncbi:unnamed protein product [Ostreobium quekettii]|uniref:Peptidase S1 domain-containing protein n=1 Tax=Ostreobium quekettii TaxID=121088 RepID=A0A8S1IJZ0_9CHLO|nr:unnamed protein product [Ostreobium quekettii]